MYQVDRDRVVEIGTAPHADVGAPLPAVVGDEHHVLLAYIVPELDPSWDGTYVTMMSPSSEEELIAIIRYLRP